MRNNVKWGGVLPPPLEMEVEKNEKAFMLIDIKS